MAKDINIFSLKPPQWSNNCINDRKIIIVQLQPFFKFFVIISGFILRFVYIMFSSKYSL